MSIARLPTHCRRCASRTPRGSTPRTIVSTSSMGRPRYPGPIPLPNPQGIAHSPDARLFGDVTFGQGNQIGPAGLDNPGPCFSRGSACSSPIASVCSSGRVARAARCTEARPPACLANRTRTRGKRRTSPTEGLHLARARQHAQPALRDARFLRGLLEHAGRTGLGGVAGLRDREPPAVSGTCTSSTERGRRRATSVRSNSIEACCRRSPRRSSSGRLAVPQRPASTPRTASQTWPAIPISPTSRAHRPRSPSSPEPTAWCRRWAHAARTARPTRSTAAYSTRRTRCPLASPLQLRTATSRFLLARRAPRPGTPRTGSRFWTHLELRGADPLAPAVKPKDAQNAHRSHPCRLIWDRPVRRRKCIFCASPAST